MFLTDEPSVVITHNSTSPHSFLFEASCSESHETLESCLNEP